MGFIHTLLRYLEQSEIQGMAKTTIGRRDSVLRRFIEWCSEYGIDKPQDVTKPLLERYQKHLFYYRKKDGEPLSSSSQHNLLSPLKIFFSWLTRENYLLYNPASELVLPKKLRRLPRYVFSEKEMASVLDQPDCQTPSGMRDRVILETFYATGIRRAELCDLTVGAIDTQRYVLFVSKGKGDKDRYVPLGQRACQWIQDYQTNVRPELLVDPGEQRLFLTDYGDPFKSTALGDLVKRYIKKTGLEVKGSCHLFRHAMATHMLENGADVRYIQAILGHSDLGTTQIYTHVSINQLQKVHAMTHPSNQ